MAPRQFARRLAASVAFALAAVAFFSAAPSQRAGSQTPPPAGFQWQELGARVFGANCSVCHQENGQGIAGAFPPLAGHVAELFAQQSGRDYLVRLVLFGLEGTISAKGSSYSSAMPPWPQLTDSEIAAALVISEHTVGRHLQNIFLRLGLSSRAAATAYAYEHHLV